MAREVCVLSAAEAVALQAHGTKPECANHGHVKRSEATARTTGRMPRAEWVGPHAIQMLPITRKSATAALTPRMVHSGARPSLGGPKCKVLQWVS